MLGLIFGRINLSILNCPLVQFCRPRLSESFGFMRDGSVEMRTASFADRDWQHPFPSALQTHPEISPLPRHHPRLDHGRCSKWQRFALQRQAHHPRPQRQGRLNPCFKSALTCGAGVGKSSITLQLALTLYLQGFRVGVLDIDLTGPSMPRMLGLEGRHIHQSRAGWIPVYLDPSSVATPTNGERPGSLCCMSIGFLLRDRGDSVVWRGPKKGSMIGQFVEDVVWGELDYLLIDTPPGIAPLETIC
jgi:NUBPL iron-transfer P-loop NTPase